jgi:Trk K+ transport system NAD-binding subunit
VVIVEQIPDHKYAVLARGHRARWLTGNVTRDDILEALSLDRARRVLLLTGDDFANLDAASKMLARAPQLRERLAVHVSDLRFKRLMGDVGADVFNIYQIAAVELVETALLPYFERTDFRDVLVFAGFGRLGQTILDELQRRAPESMDAVAIIDTEAEERTLVFDEQVGFTGDYTRHTIEGDANNLSVWRRADELCRFEDRAPAFLLVSGSDALNLRIAMRLAGRYPRSMILARSYFRSPFAESLSERTGFATFSLAELIRDSFPNEWFEG